MPHPELILFFLIISFVYASVGFGGGSSYLAVLSFYALPIPEMKLTALVCNIIVVTGGTIIFLQNKQLNWRRVLPLVAASIPLAFLGGRLKLSEDTFFIVLGCSLVVAAILLWIKTRMIREGDVTLEKSHYLKDGAIGGAIGLLSGMVGIGGGIFLSPVLNLMKWDTPKKIAATASFFILVNSVSGIAGQQSVQQQGLNYTQIAFLALAVLAGGQLGARVGVKKFNPLVIRRVTAIVVLIAGIEVLHKHLHF